MAVACLFAVIGLSAGTAWAGDPLLARKLTDRAIEAQAAGMHEQAVSIFDEASAIVSSANLNGRSLKWDTEAGVYLYRRAEVADLRRRVMAHWLPAGAGHECFDLTTAAAVWGQIARANARRAPGVSWR